MAYYMSEEQIATAMAEESTTVDARAEELTAEQPMTGETTEQIMARRCQTLDFLDELQDWNEEKRERARYLKVILVPSLIRDR